MSDLLARLPAIERPNGKLYRPRKIEASSAWMDEGELVAIYVFGTHDVAFARPHAEALVEQINREAIEVYDVDCYVWELLAGKTDWIGTSPFWDHDVERIRQSYKADEVHGRAAVAFSVRSVENATPTEPADGIMPPPLTSMEEL